MPNMLADVKTIFAAVLELESGAERSAYLEGICRGNIELRAEVEALLAAHNDGAGFLSRHAKQLQPTMAIDASAEKTASQIGPYRIIEQIGHGGMGVVYLAEQKQPVRRTVALKVIKRGMDSEQVVARFEAERQALALMNHPNIARVLDAGVTDDGRPYFVMDLVRGIPITGYCDQHRLDRRERLELFITVCQAVQHAHQKGVIHRDLKPSNILVELHDVTHVPKVIDFGVAKATSQRLTERTLVTQFSQMIGTPLYMSPEQAEFSGLDVDTRSDVYSLGVLLYELLTGTTPFDRETFKEASLDEIRRIIREDDPERPSQRISTLNARNASTVAKRQRVDVRKFHRETERELDWIVMKALEKDRSRRYESAKTLATDVQRFLDGEAVEAHPPSFMYRSRKYARRHKAAIITGASLVVMLMTATLVSSWMAMWAIGERSTAIHERTLAERQEQLAQEQRVLALEQKAEAVRHRAAAQQNLYYADIGLAQRDWQQGQISRMLTLLERHIPKPGETDLRGWEWYYLLSLPHQDLLTLRGHVEPVQALCWSPDGRHVASASEQVVIIWDATTGRKIHSLRPASSTQFIRISWSLDGTHVAVGAGRTVTIWDAETGRVSQTLDGRGVVRTVAWSSDGRFLSWSTLGDQSESPMLSIWDLDQKREFLRARAGPAQALAWRPDCEELAVSGGSNVSIWSIRARAQVHSWTAHAHDTWTLSWNPDGKQLATGAYTREVKVWEMESRSEPLRLVFDSGVANVDWSPDGQRLAVATYGQELLVHDVNTGERLQTFRGHSGLVRAAAWSPDGKKLASCSSDGTVKFWDALGAAKNVRVEVNSEPKLAQGTNFEVVRSGDRVIVQSIVDPANVVCAVVDEDLRVKTHGFRAAIGHGRSVEIWDLEKGQQEHQWAMSGNVFSLEWSPGGDRLAAGNRAGSVDVWDVESGDRLHSLKGHAEYHFVGCLAWSDDGKQLATAGWDRRVIVWDAASGQRLLTLSGHKGRIHRLSWHPNRSRLASADANEVKIWDATSGQEVLTIKPGFSGPTRWSGDGSRLQLGDAVLDASRGMQLAESQEYAEDRSWRHFDRATERLEGQPRVAEFEILRALELNPEEPSFWLYHAVVLMQLGEVEQAAAARSRVLEKIDAKAVNHPIAAVLALERMTQVLMNSPNGDQRPPGAVEFARKAAEVAPNDLRLLDSYAWLLATATNSRDRDSTLAVQMASSVCRKAPDAATPWNTLGVAQYRAGKCQAAIESLQKSMEAGGDTGYFFLAMSHWRLGHLEEARRWYDKGVAHLEGIDFAEDFLVRFRAEAEQLMGLTESDRQRD